MTSSGWVQRRFVCACNTQAWDARSRGSGPVDLEVGGDSEACHEQRRHGKRSLYSDTSDEGGWSSGKGHAGGGWGIDRNSI